MIKFKVILAASSALLSTSAYAADIATTDGAKGDSKPAEATTAPAAKAFTTGVAKGRDLLDTAISASTLDDTEVAKIGSTSIIQTIGNMPGIRAESPGTDSYASMTIRGLPLSADGSKFLQLQEDGLPVLEFGDIHFGNASQFIRSDLSLSQVQSIRGGSASTFSSNSPGGIINFISKTGDQPGGAVQYSTGLGYDLNRVDFDYGNKLSDTLRFNVGGFYHQGEGPRDTGYSDAFKGGQIKFNLTKQFGSGYVRLYLKYLDDREPSYGLGPVAVSGTNANPQYAAIPGFDLRKDTLLSRNITTDTFMDQNNAIKNADLHEGMRSVVKSIGLEAQFDVAGWTISDKFRFSAISGQYNETLPLFVLPANVMAAALGAPGGSFQYGSGANAGQAIANPTTLNGNGLLARDLFINSKLNNLDNITNDLRASRVWNAGSGKLTTTAGWYTSSQNINVFYDLNASVTDVLGGGNAHLIDIIAPNGTPLTQNGILAYSVGLPGGSAHRLYDVNYRINAPYGSLNYQIGKLAIGGSLRYDIGSISGSLYGNDLGGGRVGLASVDINGNGTISTPESLTAVLPLTQPGPVNYNYHYLSYSVGANYRFAAPFSAFARYSRGARAGADRILFPPMTNAVSGQLADPKSAFGYVKQAEVGFKYRQPGITLFITGFWASTTDQNLQVGADANGNTVVLNINRAYSAKGAELEAQFQHGPFALSLGATYTHAKIDTDTSNPALNGTTPRHAASLFFSALPQYESKLFTLGANINGTTSSLAQDGADLKQPGYVIVSPFVQVRPANHIQVALNVFNVFDKLALIQVGSGGIPATGVVTAQSLNGRTLTASVKYSF